MKVTTDFNEAIKICKPFARLRFPRKIRNVLSDFVLYYFIEPPCWTCWPHFPIGKNRIIVKELKNKGVEVPETVKVIIEVDMTCEKIENYMLDCFGHTLLYLTNPKARNECKDAINFINECGIYYEQN